LMRQGYNLVSRVAVAKLHEDKLLSK